MQSLFSAKLRPDCELRNIDSDGLLESNGFNPTPIKFP